MRKFLKNTVKEFFEPLTRLRRRKSKPPTHSFCETVTASSRSKWHIRPLTKVGKKLGGGADTQALCGRVVAWDLATDVHETHFGYACLECVQAYKRGGKRI
jgi:hypothetical protein